jgi:type 1 glutamine amidotransferase
MRKVYCFLFFILIGFSVNCSSGKRPVGSKVKILVLTERGGHHRGFTTVALKWLEEYVKEKNFEMTEINNTSLINEDFLADYDVFLQLDFPPYTWSNESKAAFEKYIEEGKGGWIGFHHASLLGEFDGYQMWRWFSGYLGGIRFRNYIAETATGTVHVEDSIHPVMKNVKTSFSVADDEWYTFDRNPRPNVHVLANVDESSYQPSSDVKMGDHPVIWVNEKVKARNVYFLMGHHASLFDNEDFKTMFGNAIMWAAGK